MLKVKFEGIRGRGWRGDIAIDAINFTPGSCSSQTPKPPPPTTQAGTLVVYHRLPCFS
jgi:hypothetical protein